jgi:hypothetical protein
MPHGAYGGAQGTSMAAPHVTGAWAAIKSRTPSATVDEVLNALTSTGQPVTDARNAVTKRRIDVLAAANSLQAGAVACTGVSLSASPAAPRTVGTSVTFTASATGCATAEYRFFTLAPTVGATWQPVTAGYQSGNSYLWTTTGKVAGTWQVKVWVRAAGSSATFDAEPTTPTSYALTAPVSSGPCTGVTLSADPVSPQPVGSSITVTASPVGCAAAEYRFWVQAPGGAMQAVTPSFGSSTTYVLNTAGKPAGVWRVNVWARRAGSLASYETASTAPLAYTITSGPPVARCTGVSLSASPAAPRPVGPSVTLTASATGCATAEYRFWTLAPTAGATWQPVTAAYQSGTTLAWDTTGKVAGTWQVKVGVRATGSTAESDATSAPASYALTTPMGSACTGVSLTVTPASPQVAGTRVTLTASASGCATAEYQFFVQAPTAGATAQPLTSGYSSSASAAWTTTGLPAGVWQISVRARAAGSTAQSEASAGPRAYTLTAPVTNGPCTGVTLSTDQSSPQPVGSSITVTASPVGCAAAEYRFWVQAPGGTMQAVTPSFTSDDTYVLETAGKPAGVWKITVWARTAGSSASYQFTLAGGPLSFTITRGAPGSCASVSLTATPASPRLTGTAVTFTATAMGCPTAEYRFFTLAPTAGASWQPVTAGYQSGNQFVWNTTGAAAGTWQVNVWARTVGSTATFDATPAAPSSYTLTSGAGTGRCTGVSLEATPASPQPVGTSVTFTATPTGCAAAEYRFWTLAPTAGAVWQAVTPGFGTGNTFSWETAGKAAGTWRFNVWARSAGSAASYETAPAAGPVAFVLTRGGSNACTGVTLTASPASPQPLGTVVTLTANAAGCATAEYRFWTLAPTAGATWQPVTAGYQSGNQLVWDTMGKAAGTWQINVWARAAGSTASSDATLASPRMFTLTGSARSGPCTGVTLSASHASTAYLPVGTTITFTASATGCASAEYRFWVIRPGGTWQALTPGFVSANTFTWDTTFLPLGMWQVTVWARSAGSAASYETAPAVSPLRYFLTAALLRRTLE